VIFQITTLLTAAFCFSVDNLYTIIAIPLYILQAFNFFLIIIRARTLSELLKEKYHWGEFIPEAFQTIVIVLGTLIIYDYVSIHFTFAIILLCPLKLLKLVWPAVGEVYSSHWLLRVGIDS
jgi:Mn2+/Fe2+ NRAMP family transporter